MADNMQAKDKTDASMQDQVTVSSDNSPQKRDIETETAAAEASTTTTTATTTKVTESVNKALSSTTTPEVSSATLGIQAQHGQDRQQPNSLPEPVEPVEQTLRGFSEDDTSEWTTIEHASIPQDGDFDQGRQGLSPNKTSSATSTPTSSSLPTAIPAPSPSDTPTPPHSIDNDHHDQEADMRTHNPLLLNTTPSP
ncbi:hypothetical protein BG000_002100, partial [Podila horticola]